jgi:hypothetical protein
MMKKTVLVPLSLACFAMTPTAALAGPPAPVTSTELSAQASKRVELLGFDICLEDEQVLDSKQSTKLENCDFKVSATGSSVPAWGVAKKLMFAVLPEVLDGTFDPAKGLSKGVEDGAQR